MWVIVLTGCVLITIDWALRGQVIVMVQDIDQRPCIATALVDFILVTHALLREVFDSLLEANYFAWLWHNSGCDSSLLLAEMLIHIEQVEVIVRIGTMTWLWFLLTNVDVTGLQGGVLRSDQRVTGHIVLWHDCAVLVFFRVKVGGLEMQAWVNAHDSNITAFVLFSKLLRWQDVERFLYEGIGVLLFNVSCRFV